jgi:GxxExxY protein
MKCRGHAAGTRWQNAVETTCRESRVGYFRADLLVANQVIVELKTASAFNPFDRDQLLSYLRASSIEVGLLMLFGPRPLFRRFVFENGRKIAHWAPRPPE